jgi:heme/copper-type cytochrome/quinol oxidase subunit 2
MAILELLTVVFNTIILSTIYSTVFLLVLLLLSKTGSSVWVRRQMGRKFRFWICTHFIISIALFVYSFSYWQDTGLGDHSRIPIGHGQDIQNEDFAYTYFYPDPKKNTPNNNEDLPIEKYKIVNDFLCAEISHQNTNSPAFTFIAYNLQNRSFEKFNSKPEYVTYALAQKWLLP